MDGSVHARNVVTSDVGRVSERTLPGRFRANAIMITCHDAPGFSSNAGSIGSTAYPPQLVVAVRHSPTKFSRAVVGSRHTLLELTSRVRLCGQYLPPAGHSSTATYPYNGRSQPDPLRQGTSRTRHRRWRLSHCRVEPIRLHLRTRGAFGPLSSERPVARPSVTCDNDRPVAGGPGKVQHCL